ncbi:MAG: hypothetical protein K2X27_04875 [Candidatus Obscuribacterales bacterium]|nr:hypothetical protein [Candidatus Obscuribacterales bacterium]
MSIHWSLKWSMFAASVISLSWFFAGWRQVNEHGGLSDWGVLLGGTATTLLLVTVQGYFIYFEEKAKGRLTKRVELFEKIEKFLEARKNAKCKNDQTGSITDSERQGGRK